MRLITNTAIFVAIIAMAVASVGCSIHEGVSSVPSRIFREVHGLRARSYQITPVTENLSAYHRVEIRPLQNPIGTMADMEARDRQRLLVNANASSAEDRTLVVVIEVLDYLKGSRLKQVLPLDLGKSILTVRLRYYDRDSGEEIGRQIISGKTSGSALLGPVSPRTPRTALSGVADGFIDQVTRRIAESER
jgi:hypothetical protein